MKKNNTSIFMVFLMVFILISNIIGSHNYVSASQTSSELSGEIEVIFNRSESEVEPYILAFETKHPNVKINYTRYDDFEGTIKTRLETGDYGDVLYFPSFVSSDEAPNYFEPLGDYETLNLKYNFLDQGRFSDGVVYGIPSSAYFVGIVYNKEVFDKAGISTLPTTIDDFLYAMYLIDEHTDAIPFYTGYEEPWVLGNWEVFPFIEMTGKASYKYNEFIKDINPFREGTVHNRTLKLLYDLVANGYTEVGRESMGWWDSVVKMNAGEVACSVIGTWALRDYKNVGPNGDNIAFMPFPNNIEGKQYVTAAADYSYAISKNSKNKELAKAFVDFMLDESGYAFDHDTISVLKTDPYPECYGDMEQTVIKNTVYTNNEAYALYNSLSTNIKLYDTGEYVRLIDAASGKTNQTFDDVMNDWNTRWEAGRNGELLEQLPTEEPSTEMVIVIENEQIELSDGEKSFVENNKELVVGYHRNLAPFSFERDGEFVGVAKEVCEMISKTSGLKLTYVGYDSTLALTEALSNGAIDFVAGMVKSDEWTNIKYSKNYIEYMNVLVRHNSVDVASLSRYATVKGELPKYTGEIEDISEAKTFSDAIKNVELLASDFTILNYYSANYYIKEANHSDLTVIPYNHGNTYHVAFSETTDPVLIAIINKCIYSINSGDIEIMLMGYMDEVVQNITLFTFLQNNPLIMLCIVIVIFLMILIVLFERYKTKDKQAIAAKKYAKLATLADESIFEYNYTNEQFKFDNKFANAFGFGTYINLATYNDENGLFNQFYQQIKDVLTEQKDAQFTIILNDEKGEKQWYRVITAVILDGKMKPHIMIGKIINIQKEMEKVESYQNLAHRDALTKLYNREGFTTYMPDRAKDVTFAVIDLDNFKTINDTLGHEGGDYALTLFASKLDQHIGSLGHSLIARYGGDEFIAMMTDVPYEYASKALADLVKSMDINLTYEGNTCKLSISVGAVYTENMSLDDDLFHKADMVLYDTKKAGKNSYTLKNIDE